ncbi:putative DNA-binding transcriptional regulator AlpA [Acinetobacter lwoffii]|jgi:predicted DNA-binding transcriptional regulator AlpA|uniref:DNA-binding transcriptional regulator AlpA n=1 Tax=Acinetobacter lwoffii TaxID=28090 RepID=A0AAW8LHS1_ACILW|nr:helix-turn-helix domain-containing protein [Acinetobacter lwoffii]MCJ0927877.1 DNA-binding protein [Acinetobacter lwoffii]MDR6628314.1 putative DNA-binding transcriptional regulator AlpA [Acinetobacter lwoffii]
MEVGSSRWMPEIFAMFEELKSQNQYLVEKVERLEEIVDKKPLTLNTAEAAKVLGYSAEYVRKLDRDGKMPKRVSKDGQRSRWNRSDIEKMAKSRKTGRPRSNS